MEQPASPVTQRCQFIALTGHLALLFWVVFWQISLSPHPHINPVTAAIAWAIPLLLPLKGLLEKKAYTHAWANFVLLLYFMHSLTLIYVDSGERWLAVVELVLTTATFVGNLFYARYRGKELGLALPKLSEIEKEEKKRFSRSSSPKK